MEAGLRFVYSPSSLRSPSRAFSGLMWLGTWSHLGPPTAPSSTLSDARQPSMVSCGSGTPYSSRAQPPARYVLNSKSQPNLSATAFRASTAAPVISGPIPSPGTKAILKAISIFFSLITNQSLITNLLRSTPLGSKFATHRFRARTVQRIIRAACSPLETGCKLASCSGCYESLLYLFLK